MVFIDGSCIVDDLSGAAGEQPAETREVLVQLREKKHLPGALNHTVATNHPHLKLRKNHLNNEE